jgi:aminoglycoside phosphotransferase family enzyme/predicted kinase
MHRAGSVISPLDTSLVDQLMSPAAFDYPVKSVERIETHISWVILTDRYAYKIKKPLVLDFLDFGDLEKRHHYCNEELRLNRPWAKDIYLDVVAITIDAGQAKFAGTGTAIEYAVRMRRFDQNMRLDHQLALGLLTTRDMRDLGEEIATRHAGALVVSSDFRQRVLQMTTRQMRDNFSALDGHVDANRLSTLQTWTERELGVASKVFGERFDAGLARDCHGDLHLANLVRMPNGIRAFDCIEFNADMRRIDVVCDYSFLVMDLIAKGRSDLAAHFINRYLERSGDYAGIALLDPYIVYRCLVRAKVAVISSQERELEEERIEDIAEAERYCRIALRQTDKPAPLLIIMFGLSGSGKTWVSERLMAALPAIRIRSDIERKRLSGLAEATRGESDIGSGIYAEQSRGNVYDHLLKTAKSILTAKHNVILDATFLHAADRESALAMADKSGYATVIVNVRAPITVMQTRLQQREQGAVDASEAGLAVLEYQRSAQEPPTAAEFERTIVFDNDGQADIEELLRSIQERGDDPRTRNTIPHSAKSSRRH